MKQADAMITITKRSSGRWYVIVTDGSGRKVAEKSYRTEKQARDGAKIVKKNLARRGARNVRTQG